jgi:NhaP-type Na+/H+ or K+/H+ antiporter
MEHEVLIGLVAIVALGQASQWVAWRLGVPAILILLAVGFLAGPVLGWIHPDDILGEVLIPLVSLTVALILFEGGLSLRIRELNQVGGVVRNLVTVGALITFGIAAFAARTCLGFSTEQAVLLGAILVVTGPTVIAPLLRQVRPVREVASVLKWEGILIDPIGAVGAVLIYEAIVSAGETNAASIMLLGVVETLVVGGLLGIAISVALVFVLRRYWVPDYLHSSLAVALVLVAFAVSNHLQEESGLLTVTVMGVILANQRKASIQHVIEFKENLRVLLISILFIVLAARVQIDSLLDLGWGGVAFLIVIIFVARPLSVLASTWRSSLTMGQRAFLCWTAPRGIVAASVASVFALRLAEENYPGAEGMAAATFLVIAATVLQSGLTAGWVARKLGIAEPNPQGSLIIGAHPLARQIAAALKEEGFETLLIDSNRRAIATARMEGLNAHYGNALSEEIADDLDMLGMGRMLALTPNDQINALSALHFIETFGRIGVYQLPASKEAASPGEEGDLPHHLRGRLLFGEDLHFDALYTRFRAGAGIKTTKLTDEFTYEAFQDMHGDAAVPLFIISAGNALQAVTADSTPKPTAGQRIVSLMNEPEPE